MTRGETSNPAWRAISSFNFSITYELSRADLREIFVENYPGSTIVNRSSSP
jgi:hypothetical protein